MIHFFEQIDQIFKDMEFASILGIILIITLIVLNITACVCVISMRSSLKRIADQKAPKAKKHNDH